VDRRVQRTKASLHDALIGLAREKPYPSIAVKEILDRANVGRSTFYMHFRDKDDLLESGIHEILGSIQSQRRTGSTLERVVAFSLPLLKHIDEHRRAAGPKMTHEGRVIMHEHMRDVLTSLIADELAIVVPGRPKAQIPTALAARHVASTFVLVLNWWVENDEALSPAEVDARFRALVIPILTAL
jgi:AcrR family transcriptional regulator